MSAVKRIRSFFRLLGILLLFICGIELKAQNSAPPKANGCPEIVVAGPLGVSHPGELVRFEVSLDPNPSSDLTFHWTTSAGQVDEGQATKQIGVRYLMEMNGTTLIATVKVGGLPNHCQDLASGDAPLIWDPGPELISEFSIAVGSIHRQKLKVAALSRPPNNQIYIIEYFPEGTGRVAIKRKKDLIMEYMVGTLKQYGPSITILTATGDQLHTKIFHIPPGASNPTP